MELLGVRSELLLDGAQGVKVLRLGVRGHDGGEDLGGGGRQRTLPGDRYGQGIDPRAVTEKQMATAAINRPSLVKTLVRAPVLSALWATVRARRGPEARLHACAALPPPVLCDRNGRHTGDVAR